MPLDRVYVSYVWEVEEQNHLVDKLEQACSKRKIQLLRDKKEITYKESIKEYMERLTSGDAIVLVLSEDYFKSYYCMYELRKIYENENFKSRVYPILVEGTSLEELALIGYIRFWEEKIKELDEKLRGISAVETKSVRDKLDEYAENRRLLDYLVNGIKDMNLLTEKLHIETDFSAVIDSINGLKKSIVDHYIVNGDGTVTDTETNLMWKQHSEGHSEENSNALNASKLSWHEVMAKFKKNIGFSAYNDWRMPTCDELKTLVKMENHPTINTDVFPNTPARFYWSSSEKDASKAWVVSFSYGGCEWNDKNSVGCIRLVRSVL